MYDLILLLRCCEGVLNLAASWVRKVRGSGKLQFSDIPGRNWRGIVGVRPPPEKRWPPPKWLWKTRGVELWPSPAAKSQCGGKGKKG